MQHDSSNNVQSVAAFLISRPPISFPWDSDGRAAARRHAAAAARMLLLLLLLRLYWTLSLSVPCWCCVPVQGERHEPTGIRSSCCRWASRPACARKQADGVFTRAWTYGNVTLDCNAVDGQDTALGTA